MPVFKSTEAPASRQNNSLFSIQKAPFLQKWNHQRPRERRHLKNIAGKQGKNQFESSGRRKAPTFTPHLSCRLWHPHPTMHPRWRETSEGNLAKLSEGGDRSFAIVKKTGKTGRSYIKEVES